LRSSEEKNKKEIIWEIEGLKILIELEEKQPQVLGHPKKWIEPRYNLMETDMWDKQNKMVPAGSQRYQEGWTGLARNQKQKT